MGGRKCACEGGASTWIWDIQLRGCLAEMASCLCGYSREHKLNGIRSGFSRDYKLIEIS